MSPAASRAAQPGRGASGTSGVPDHASTKHAEHRHRQRGTRGGVGPGDATEVKQRESFQQRHQAPLVDSHRQQRTPRPPRAGTRARSGSRAPGLVRRSAPARSASRWRRAWSAAKARDRSGSVAESRRGLHRRSADRARRAPCRAGSHAARGASCAACGSCSDANAAASENSSVPSSADCKPRIGGRLAQRRELLGLAAASRERALPRLPARSVRSTRRVRCRFGRTRTRPALAA